MSTTEKRLITLKESDALRAMPAMNVPAMISAAIEKGANIETLTGLFQLARDVSQMTARQAFYAAKAKFKSRCPRIKKTATADIQTRAGGKYSYSYSPLEEVTEVVDPILSDLGLSYEWKSGPYVAGHVSQICVLSHELGHEAESGPMTLPLGVADGRMSGAQQVGSVTTYARRYSLCGILGITPEADDDAQGANGDRVGGAIPPRAAKSHARGASTADGSPAHVPMGVAVPELDENDPALVTESRNLFPTQEDDVERERIWTEIVKLSGRIEASKTTKRDKDQWKEDKAAAWLTYAGTATPSTADLSALSDIMTWLKTREPK